MKSLELDSEYIATVDSTNENELNKLILLFGDASVNQTWAYNHVRSKKCSTLVLKHKGIVVAIAIVRLVTLSGLKIGMAYLGSGPLWQLKNEEINLNSLRYTLLALRREYVWNRKLYLRISPPIYTNHPNFDDIFKVFHEAEGFKLQQYNDRTLFLDLNPSEIDLRKELHHKWRYNLNRVEKEEFNVRIGKSDDLFQSFKIIYTEMLERKKYPGAINIDEIEKIQSNLSEDLKYTIIICESENRPIAGGVYSTIGNTGIYFLGATGNSGIKNHSSNLYHWEMIKWMKKHGFQMYDLCGVSPERIPETYQFKAGIVGKNHTIHKRIGIMDACENPLSKIVVESGMYIQKLSSLFKKLI